MTEKLAIARRLKEFAEQNYDSTAAFARALGMRPQEIQMYLSGRSKPGNVLQERLRSIGCNVELIMTGKSSTFTPQVHDSSTKYSHPRSPIVTALRVESGQLIIELGGTMANPPDESALGYWLKVHDTSMEPRYQKGEHVFFRKDVKPEHRDFTVALYDDLTTAVIRQVNMSGEQVVLTALDTSIPPIVLKKSQLKFLAKITHTKSK